MQFWFSVKHDRSYDSLESLDTSAEGVRAQSEMSLSDVRNLSGKRTEQIVFVKNYLSPLRKVDRICIGCLIYFF